MPCEQNVPVPFFPAAGTLLRRFSRVAQSSERSRVAIAATPNRQIARTRSGVPKPPFPGFGLVEPAAPDANTTDGRRSLSRGPTTPALSPMPNSQCTILVPVYDAVELGYDDALRQLERAGYVVWRVPGFAAIDQARCRMATEPAAQKTSSRTIRRQARSGMMGACKTIRDCGPVELLDRCRSAQEEIRRPQQRLDARSLHVLLDRVHGASASGSGGYPRRRICNGRRALVDLPEVL